MDNDHGKKRVPRYSPKEGFLFPFVLFILSFFFLPKSFQRYVIMGQDYFCPFAFFFLLIGASLKQSCLIYFENQKFLKFSSCTVGPFITWWGCNLYIAVLLYMESQLFHLCRHWNFNYINLAKGRRCNYRISIRKILNFEYISSYI